VETIRTYLENMFASLPKTNEMMKIKNDLLSNMEDKYLELKSNGKSENEAIGIVISEFGNIDELIRELGIEHVNESNSLPTLTEFEVNDFIETNKRTGKLVGIGVVLCMIGGAFLILTISGISENLGDVLGLIPLLVLVAIAVGLFIYSGSLDEKFKYLEGGFELPAYFKAQIQQKNREFNSLYNLSVIIGVTICILSPVILFVSSIFGDNGSTYGVVGLILMVAIAVYIFIYFEKIRESYKRLLCLDEFSKPLKVKEEDKVIGAVAAIVWPLAVCIFLVSGLVFYQWHINWIIFPITGILFGMFCAAYNILKEKK